MENKEKEWLKQRKKGIGGSDAAAIVGQNPYKNIMQLWEEKTGRRKPDDISNKDCVIFGKNAEAPMREIFKLDYPQYAVEHQEFVTVSNPEWEFIRGSFDGVLTEKETGKKGVLEIKTTNILQSMQKEKWVGDMVPQNYYCQILHYFLVRPDFEFAILKARLRTEWDGVPRAAIKHYYFLRNDEGIQKDLKFLFEREVLFWDCVLKDEPPKNFPLPTI